MKLSRPFETLYDTTLALVYPLACAACGAAHVERSADTPACAACWRATRIYTGAETCCWKCGALAAADVPAAQRETVYCRRCASEAYTAARAIGAYEGALRAAVLTLKRAPHVGARLAQLLVATQQRAPLAAATRIVPVPLHPERERERGFNQAALLAQALARRTHLPLDTRSLVRTTHTAQHRAGMDARARRETVASAFEVARPRLVAGESVLLLDDVFTTGATVAACAHALKEAGAADVFVLTVARA
ncbi:MAG TPA: double zinc ribbon domain-containing protein [Pyrinomonadaceae bacterium]|jgi:ComF family protein|nr:double zinc ribbon domain-containing protein [Pyrinomonadaceae bacterium]